MPEQIGVFAAQLGLLLLVDLVAVLVEVVDIEAVLEFLQYLPSDLLRISI